MKNARPFREVLPEMAEKMENAIAARGRPKIEAPKIAVALRLDPDVLDRFKLPARTGAVAWRKNCTRPPAFKPSAL